MLVSAQILDELSAKAPASTFPEFSNLPDPDKLLLIITSFKRVLFPHFFCRNGQTTRDLVNSTLTEALTGLALEMNALRFHQKGVKGTEEILSGFCKTLPEVRSLLHDDIRAALTSDPVAPDPGEVLISYPGFQALLFQRLAHRLHLAGVPVLPRMITEAAHTLTGIDIHPGAKIGAGCFIDHGTGVVIGATASIGTGVTLYQGVTLGAKSFPKDRQGQLIYGQKRHPDIGDHCTIYSGASILGNIRVGHHSVIGGNVWLTRDVPPYSRITQHHYRQEEFSGNGEGI